MPIIIKLKDFYFDINPQFIKINIAHEKTKFR